MFKMPVGYGLGCGQKLNKGDVGFKPPMLVVGTNIFLRKHVPAAQLQNWDIHLLFFPQSDATWKVGMLGVSRTDGKVFFNLGIAPCIDKAIENAVKGIIIPMEIRKHALLWLNLSIYRCPKISLKDVLSLENYTKAA